VSRTLHVESWGDPGAPRAICLHGVTGHGAGWRRLAETRLAGFHVLAPDLIGHGSSPYEPPWSIAEHVDALVATLGDEPSLWIGHSFGGRLAFELAARHPGTVDRLVLLDPAIRVDPHIALLVAEDGRKERSYASYDEGVDRRFAESLLSRASRDDVADTLTGFLVESKDGLWRYRYSQSAVIAAYGEMAFEPPPFTAVCIPTLLVLGAESYVPYDHLLGAHREALGDLLEIVTVPGGHTVLWDAFEETGEAIAGFLASPS
jgi:lipase